MDALCRCMFIISETIVNIEHEDYVSNNLFMSDT